MADNQGGYDCEFIEKPPKPFQSECPICLQVLREPYQATCCGYSFCRACIHRIKARYAPCPCCKANEFDHYPNKGLQRSLCEFKVHCSNKEQGCQWVGELGQLDNHLNLNLSQQNQLQGCQLSQIKCLHCSELFLRSGIEDHQNNQCPRRPFSCEYCKEFDSCYEEVTTNHWPVCGSYSMPCTNKCGETLQRQNLENHIANDCPLTNINCDFQHVGCEVRLPRKDMPAHLGESVATHMSLHMASHKKLKEENKKLKQRVAELERDNKTQSTTGAQTHLFIMNNFSKYKRKKEIWASSQFYSHFRGYNMLLAMRVSQTHVEAFIHIVKREHDEHLSWPFHGSLTISVIGECDTYTKTIICNETNAVDFVTESFESGHVSQDFLPISSIHRYLRGDKLYIKISEVSSLNV